jgi:hypothetical protein
MQFIILISGVLKLKRDAHAHHERELYSARAHRERERKNVSAHERERELYIPKHISISSCFWR